MLRLRQFFTLAGLTAVEAIRQPICLLLATTCIFLTALVSMLFMHNFGEGGTLAADSGLALHFLFGLLIVGYASCSSLSREMHSGTAAAVLSKPVSRDVFFLAKYAGIVAVVIMFSSCCILATLMGERAAEKFYTGGAVYGWHRDLLAGGMLICAPLAAFAVAGVINYRWKKPFTSTAFFLLPVFLVGVLIVSGFFDVTGELSAFDFRVQWRIVPAGLLVTFALLVVTAIALCVSTRFGMVPTMTICSVVFVLGLVSDYLLGRPAQGSTIISLIYNLVPNWQHFWVTDVLREGGSVPGGYILNAAVYAVLYLSAFLSLGMLSFRNSEVK